MYMVAENPPGVPPHDTEALDTPSTHRVYTPDDLVIATWYQVFTAIPDRPEWRITSQLAV